MSLSGPSGHRIITLTTDFGLRDSFQAEMKGVILSLNPSAVIIDVTHEISPCNIPEGAYTLGAAVRHFPQGSIHIGVVDPGVGSDRRPLIVEANGRIFVGPDNGIFSYILRGAEFRAIQIAERSLIPGLDSPTFQGRDVFAPAAAMISTGMPPAAFGPEVNEIVSLNLPEQLILENSIVGEVVHIDRFGNAITNITQAVIYKFGKDPAVEFMGNMIRLVRSYSQAEEEGLFCLVNSSGYLEFFMKQKRASESLGIDRGARAIVTAMPV